MPLFDSPELTSNSKRPQFNKVKQRVPSYSKAECELPDRGNVDGVVRRQDIFTTGSRKYGATMRQFQAFVAAANSGMSVKLDGENYVALSRGLYEKLTANSSSVKPAISTGGPTSDDVRREIDAILNEDRMEARS